MLAILIRPVFLSYLNVSLTINTHIVVDTEKSIGFWNGIHFDVAPDEYVALN